MTRINMAKIKSYTFLIKPFLVFCILYTIAFLGIIFAHVNYVDDLGRSMFGYTEWNNFGRYASTGLSYILHTGHYLADISPLGQLIAVVFLSAASTIAIYILIQKQQFAPSHYIAGLLIGVSPYFLECFSYKFDSPYMALSILASFLPLLFYKRTGKNYVFHIVSFLCGILMCTTYQAASGIYFIFIGLLMFNDFVSNRTSFKKAFLVFITQCCPFLLGIIFYKIIMMPSITDAIYISNTIPSLANFIPNLFRNLKDYYHNVDFDFCMLWKALIALILGSFVIIPAIKTKKILMLLYSFLMLSFIAVANFGFYVVLEKPLFAPRAMYGCCASLGLISILLVDWIGKKILLNLPIYGIAWCFLVFAFIYGNVLIGQARWDEFRVNMTLSTLTAHNILNDSIESVSFNGTAGHAPEIKNTLEKYPILKRLVFISYAGDGWIWGTAKICNYYGLNIESNNCIANTDYNIDNPKELRTYYDNILYNDRKIIINLK